MRHFPALLAAVLVVGLAGCGGGVQLPPVAPEKVEIFLPGSFPIESYKVITRVEEQVGLDVPDNELINRARVRAAELGADALVIQAIRQTTEGRVEMDLGQEQQKILEAVAVYYPSRHPELSGK